MTEIKRTIQDLKPGKRYLVKVQAVDNNINSVIGEKNIIIETPQDDTIPSDVTGLYLSSNSKSVMFKFNSAGILDLKEYEYELYSANSLSSTLLASRSKLYKYF
jgi:hypothetical protein